MSPELVQLLKTWIVIYCSDPRKEKANLWKDIKKYLIPEHERWAPIGFFGAPVALAHPIFLPIDFACIIGQIEFIQTQFEIEGFVIVSHDCGYYQRITSITNRNFTLGDKMADVSKGSAILRERFQSVPVKGFFKKPGQPGFEEIH